MPQIERLADRLHQGVTFITFDGANIPAVRGGCKREARAYRLAVHHQCAGAADPVLASDMRAGEQAVLAQKVSERKTVIDGARYPFAVTQIVTAFMSKSGWRATRSRGAWSNPLDP